MQYVSPNFLIVGAPKCGTTSLAFYLSQHPSVFLPADQAGISTPKVEPHYFVKPKSAMGNGPGSMNGLSKPDRLEDYLAIFKEAEGEIAIGEASPGYLYLHEYSIPQIQNKLGDPKIIILLRDPVARAYSSHLHHVRKRHDLVSFEKALELESVRAKQGGWFGCQLRGVGEYFEQVQAYFENFSSVHVIITEDMRTDLNGVLSGAFNFLGVDAGFIPSETEPRNVGVVPRVQIVERACLSIGHRLRFIPGMHRSMERIRNFNRHRPKVNQLTAGVLASEFQPGVEKLSKLLGRDLSFWLEKY